MNDLRRAMFRQLQNLPVDELDGSRSGKLMSRFTNDLAGVETAVTRGLVTMVFSSLVLGVSALLLFSIDGRLALLTILALLVTLAGPRLLSRRAQDRSYERKVSETTMTAVLIEDLRAAAVIRTYGLESERRRASASASTTSSGEPPPPGSRPLWSAAPPPSGCSRSSWWC